MLAQAAAGKPAVDVTADDGVRHELWVIEDAATIAALTRAVDALPALYIADGHHRSAAAARVAKARGGEGAHDYFLAVLLPQEQMTILDYNRVLRDLNGRSPEKLLAEIGERYAIEASEAGAPASAGEVGMVSRRPLVSAHAAAATGGKEARATIRSRGCRSRCWPATSSSRFSASPIRAATSASTSSAAAAGSASWRGWSLPGKWRWRSRSIRRRCSDLMAVADAGAIMPPKSTWFEPKLADGMVSHILD